MHPSLGTNLPGICIVHDLKLCQAGFAKLCKLLPAETAASCQEEQSMSASCSTSHLQFQISISTVGICFTQLPYICCIDTWLQLLNRPCFLGEFLPSYVDSSCTSFTWHIPTTVELTGLLVTPNPADLRRQEGEEIQQKIGCLTKVIFQRHTLHRIF